MPAKIVYERFLWFHNCVKAEKYPNARILAENFELSQKTAQRDIEFIRDRLYAPLVYMPDRRGYAYEEKAYELPAIWINEEELAALFIASRLASTIPDRSLKSSFKSFLEQIWHPEQKQAIQSDGSLCLIFTVADLREVKREVLKYGSEVEVLSPVALQQEVREEIEKMAKIYRAG